MEEWNGMVDLEKSLKLISFHCQMAWMDEGKLESNLLLNGWASVARICTVWITLARICSLGTAWTLSEPSAEQKEIV